MQHRTALITAGARGLGVSVAHYLASRGIRVGINYRNSYNQACSLQEELNDKYGMESLLIKGDVTIPETG